MASPLALAAAQTRKKRKRKEPQPKLVVGDSVEVRSTEDGFEGSWHSATVIECGDLVRRVRYTDILVDDTSSERYTESVIVSSTLDGVVPNNGVAPNYRGVIRPLPPSFELTLWGFHYGLCVDAYYNDAWWEGVIFDHEGDSEERLVFFPDGGDQMTIKIENLRVTQDWGEEDEMWTLRGDWLFLELIEECEKEFLLPVSVRQLWYDLRIKEAFVMNIKEWTCWIRPMWDELVSEVVHDSIKLVAEHILSVTGGESAAGLIEGPSKRTRSSKLASGGILHDHVEENQLELSSQEETRLKRRKSDSSDILDKRKKIKVSSEVELSGQVDKSATLRFQIVKDPNSCALTIKGNLGHSDDRMGDGECDPKAITPISSVTDDREDLREESKNHCSSRDNSGPRKRKGKCKVSDIGENVRNALLNYLRFAKVNTVPGKPNEKASAVKEVRKHLLDMGWKVQEIGNSKLRYISPEGRTYHSLVKVCENLTETKANIMNQCTQNFNTSLVDASSRSLNTSAQQVYFPAILQQNHGREGSGATPLGEAIVSEHSEKETGAKNGASPLLESRSSNILEEILDVGSKFCPQAVVELFGRGPKGAIPKNLRLKAQKHLAAMGWTFLYIKKDGGHEMQYVSPNHKYYTSLREACKVYIEQGLLESMSPVQRVIMEEESKGQQACDKLSSAIVCTEDEEYLLPVNWQSGKNHREKSGLSQAREVGFSSTDVKNIKGPQNRRNENSFPFASRLRQSNVNASSLGTRQDRMLAVSCSETGEQTLDQNPSSQKAKKQKKVGVSTRKGAHCDDSYPPPVLRSNKRVRQVVASNPAYYTPRTILSWLIDNNVVLPRNKVYYKKRNQQRPLAEGKITRDGIKCSCCQKVFSVSGFESHAGSVCRRPSENIFLEDGRSLLECQKQMIEDSKLTGCTLGPYRRIKSNIFHIKNDSICSVCHYGGILLLCDQCPSSFHLNCIGLQSLPKGKWFCPSCRCGICGQSEFNGNVDQPTEKTVLYCDQCERQYHLGCIRERRVVKLDHCLKENWFCSNTCEKIFVGLHKLLGKSIAVGMDELSWTILKFSKDNYGKDSFKNETIAEHHSKLNVALAVLHECFEPIKEPQTKDLVKDVLFNKRSLLKRLDFQGFYTVLLEKGDELISVATVRVYGGKVAELPLVGTRVQYRRKGMCRILMNLLEEKLKEFGVERLLLPAIPSVLHAWTTSFGFSKMTGSERLEFLEYIFLDFQDTTMCQKLLKNVPTLKVIGPRANRHGHENELILSNENVACDRGGFVPKDAKRNDQSDTLKQIPVENSTFDTCSSPERVSPIIISMPQENLWSNYENCSAGSPDQQKEYKGRESIQCLTYYRRRKICSQP